VIVELLRKWAELEPDRCEIYPNSAELLNVFLNPWIINFSAVSIELGAYDAAALQRAVQASIDNRDWRCKIFNSAAGWSAKVVPSSALSNMTFENYLEYRNQELAIALLNAYVVCLEANQ
jgi:hypothetical protein